MNDNENETNRKTSVTVATFKGDNTRTMILKGYYLHEETRLSSSDKRHQSETLRHYPDNPPKSAGRTTLTPLLTTAEQTTIK